jgi:peptidyl-prolyl cis-trans isomerase SurA
MSTMKRALLSLGAALVFAAVGFSAELVERIVARVNDRLITQSEFDKRVDLTAKGPQAPKDRETLRRDALDDLIKEKLLAERAKELSVAATDGEVDEALQRVKGQYNLATDAEFDAALVQSGLTRDELKKQLRDTITLQKVVGRDVAARLEVTDDMLRLEYERQKEKLYPVPEQARVAEIVVRFNKNSAAEREHAGQRIAEAQEKIKAGVGFADVAKEYSEGAAKDRGGDLGAVSKGELMPALDAAVFADPPDEYPPPVLMPSSMHLFRVRDRKPAAFKPFNDIKEELRKKISDELYEKRFNEYVNKLRKEAFVKIYDGELEKLEKQEKKS